MMSSLLGVGVGRVGVYPHRYGWGNTSCNLLCCCRLHFPVDIMVWPQTWEDGVTGKTSIWVSQGSVLTAEGTD